jgi:hypothetical protein
MPSSRSVLTSSAFLLAALGLGALFAPAGAAVLLGLERSATDSLSLAAPGLLGIAGLDWVGRGLRMGGIYGRPLTMANVLTGAVATSTLARLLSEQGGTTIGWLLVGALGLYTTLFGLSMVRAPDLGGGA